MNRERVALIGRSGFPTLSHVPGDALEMIIGRLVAFGRCRAAAEEAVVIAYVLRGRRAPFQNQLPELNALAKRLENKPTRRVTEDTEGSET